MPPTSQLHAPQLVNVLGHAAGALLFSIFLFLLVRDRTGFHLRGGRRAVAAAVLALLWNAFSLLHLALADERDLSSRVVIAVSSSALSLLPAVLFHLALDRQFRWLSAAGYVLGAAAVVMHSSEVFLLAPQIHRQALNIINVGFGALTVIAAAGILRSGDRERRRIGPRLLGTMAIFLFALSFVHLGSDEALHGWPVELLIHHAGIPLALYLLLQDYRSVFLDAFIRLLANVLLASGFAGAATWLSRRIPPAASDSSVVLLVAALTLAFLAYAAARPRAEALLTYFFFRRPDVRATLQELRARRPAPGDPAEYPRWLGQELARFFSAEPLPPMSAELCARLRERQVDAPVTSAALPELREMLEQAGAEVVMPLRVARSDVRYLALGRRQGGRRYLSEDLIALARIAAQVGEDIEQFREAELERLVSQAELRALQSQIHPHFLFNALNALYGLIPKDAPGARRTVLNLADIFRYFLRTETTLVPLEEELRIVEAYLEIESLRLGDRLRTAIRVDEQARRIPIPLLSIQPLVENAVKHGVASNPLGGEVGVEAAPDGGHIRICVRDSGPGFQASSHQGSGVALDNVRRRLQLCYGPEARLVVDSAGGTAVSFLVPVAQGQEAAR